MGRVGPDWTPGREATASAKPETPVTGTGVVTRAMSHQKREQQLQQQAQDDTMCDAG